MTAKSTAVLDSGSFANTALSSFPSQCGANILHGLNISIPYTDQRKANRRDAKFSDLQVSRFKRFFNEKCRGVGRLVATTSSSQKLVEQAFSQSGWKEVDTFRNPNTGRTIKVWTYAKQKVPTLKQLKADELALKAQAVPQVS